MLGMRGLHQNRDLFGWLSRNKMIYPPSPSQISTKNRLFPTYIEYPTELGAIILDKDPLILNFTFPGDRECNKVTQALYDILGNLQYYPHDVSKPIGMASIACDSAGGKELQSKYIVNKIPSLILLEKQMMTNKHIPLWGSDETLRKDLLDFIKSIY